MQSAILLYAMEYSHNARSGIRLELRTHKTDPLRPTQKDYAKKRPSTALDHDHDLGPEDIHLPGESPTDDGDLEIDQTCDQVRHKITAFINNGGMKVTEFQRAIGVNAGSYGRFMKARGADAGFDNGTYAAAYVFFKERELAGVKMPTPAKKKRKTTGATKAEGNGKGKGDGDEFEVSGIELDGEDEQAVEIYDTCDDIRRKIAAHLRLPGVTQASFLRALSTSFPADAPRKLSAKQLNDFTAKKGPMGGNSSGVFYAAYVYFEKLRIKQGKKKGKKRVEMEEKWGVADGYRGKAGFPTKEARFLWCGGDERPVMDQYGVTSVQKRR